MRSLGDRSGGAVSSRGQALVPKMEAILKHLDPVPDREGLWETPARAAKAWEYWTSGYTVDPSEVLKTFDDGARGYDEMVIQTDIPVYSKCEHHLADIFGFAHIGYVPNGRVVGLSKLVRVVEVFARRLQVQERMTVQIAEALMTNLRPKGVGVILQCRHMCMESRGVNRPGVTTTTTALRGVLLEATPRAEFLSAIGPLRGRRV